MSMDYIRKTYGVPVKRHGLVRQIDGPLRGELLVVTSCSCYVHAWRPGVNERRAVRNRFHPLALEYKTADGWYHPMTKETTP